MPPTTISYSAPSMAADSRGDLAVYIYCALLAAIAAGVVALLLSSGASLESPVAVTALAAMAFWWERQRIRLNRSMQLSVAFLPLLFTAVAFGPLAAMAVAAASLLGDFGMPHLRWAVATTSRMIVGAAAGLVALALNPVRFDDFPWLLAVVAVAVSAEATVDLSLGALALRLRRGGSVIAAARGLAPVFLASIPVYAPVVAILIYAYHTLSPWTLLLFLLPALAAQWSFTLYRKQRATGHELTAANERLERANLSFAIALVATLDARDPYMSGHSTAVSRYARDIARRLDLGE